MRIPTAPSEAHPYAYASPTRTIPKPRTVYRPFFDAVPPPQRDGWPAESSFVVNARSPFEGATLRYSAQSASERRQHSIRSRAPSRWTPDAGQTGAHAVRFTVDDGVLPEHRDVAIAVAAQSASPFAAVAPALQPFVDKGEVAGVVTLVATKDKVLHLAAVGRSDLSTGRAMRTSDLFWIASMTKPMVGVCIGILVDEGKLAFDDPLAKVLPEFAGLTVRAENGRAGRCGACRSRCAMS